MGLTLRKKPPTAEERAREEQQVRKLLGGEHAAFAARYGLDPSRLTAAECEELLALDAGAIERDVDSGRKRRNLALLTPEQRTRRKSLIEQAQREDVRTMNETQRARAQAERDAREIAALVREAETPDLGRRVAYAEQGSVQVPRFVWQWVRNSREDACFTIADAGVLWFMLAGFENPKSLPEQMRMVTEDGKPTLVLRENQGFVWLGWANPQSEPDESYVNVRRSISRLARNEWLEIAGQGGGELRLRLGERAERLRTGDPRHTT